MIGVVSLWLIFLEKIHRRESAVCSQSYFDNKLPSFVLSAIMACFLFFPVHA